MADGHRTSSSPDRQHSRRSRQQQQQRSNRERDHSRSRSSRRESRGHHLQSTSRASSSSRGSRPGPSSSSRGSRPGPSRSSFLPDPGVPLPLPASGRSAMEEVDRAELLHSLESLEAFFTPNTHDEYRLRPEQRELNRYIRNAADWNAVKEAFMRGAKLRFVFYDTEDQWQDQSSFETRGEKVISWKRKCCNKL